MKDILKLDELEGEEEKIEITSTEANKMKGFLSNSTIQDNIMNEP